MRRIENEEKNLKIFFLPFMMLWACFFSSCSVMKDKNFSWKSQKNKFKYINKREFISDSLLQLDIKSCHKIRSPILDSIFTSEKNIYLYSWNERDSTKDEFSIVQDRGELGLTILYLIFNKQNQLISITNLATAGREGMFLYETKSRFIDKDSILRITSITQWLDSSKDYVLRESIGDTTFSYLIIDKMGETKEIKIKEVKNLDLK